MKRKCFAILALLAVLITIPALAQKASRTRKSLRANQASGLVAAAQNIPTFLPPDVYPVQNPLMAAVGDFNGDGLPDIVTANGLLGVSLLLRNSDGTFQPAKKVVKLGPNHPGYNYVAVGDFNGDGKLDIATAKSDGTVGILLGKGDGTFQLSLDTATAATAGVPFLAVADFNGDGKLDLAVTQASNVVPSTVVVLLGNGNGTFNAGPIISGSRVIAADFNGDGRQDLLVYGVVGQAATSYIKLGNGDGTFIDGQQNPVPSGASTVLLADINADGKQDLIWYQSVGRRGAVSNAAVPCLAVGDGTFVCQIGVQQDTFRFLSVTNPVAVDFNNDGIVDLFSLSEAYLGVGNGTFAAFPTPALGSGAVVPACIDCFLSANLSHRGVLDVIYANKFASTLSVFRNTGGNPPSLAQLSLNATSVVGGSSVVDGAVSIGGPAPVGGAVIALLSDNPAAFFPGGATVTIPAGSRTATFTIATTAVSVVAHVTISASWLSTTLTAKLAVVPPFTLSSVTIAPASLFGFFQGNLAVGTVTLSGPASDGVVINLTSSNSAAVGVPTSVTVAPQATTATFPASALHVTADTPVTVTGFFQGVSQSGTVTSLKGLDTVVVTKAEYAVARSQLKVQGTATDSTVRLQVFNATTKVSLGFATLASGKFNFQATVGGGVTSVAVQSSKGGLAMAPVVQK